MARKRNKRKRLKPGRLLFLLLCLAVLVGCGAGVGLVFASVRDMPAMSPAALEASASTMIYDQDGNLVTNVGIKNSVPVNIKEVPEHVVNAFLAIEDPAFYQHHGFSLRGIARAAWSDLTSREIRQGGSTITQQLVKLSFLSPEQTIKRKIQELILSIQVERRYTKDEILEMYLNNIYMGEGCYGIQAAAQTFFGKDVGDLKLEEAALLAGLPQAPSAYNPFKILVLQDGEKEEHIKTIVSRRNTVLDSMVKNNYIDQALAEAAKTTELELDTREPSSRQYPYPYFLDYVTEVLIEKYGETEVFNGGLKVYTTLDRKYSKLPKPQWKIFEFPSSKTGCWVPTLGASSSWTSSGTLKPLWAGGNVQSGVNRATMTSAARLLLQAHCSLRTGHRIQRPGSCLRG